MAWFVLSVARMTSTKGSPRSATTAESPVTQITPDRMPKHDRPAKPAPRAEPMSSRPVEPHWEPVIAAATD
jgi:hypothetical protein